MKKMKVKKNKKGLNKEIIKIVNIYYIYLIILYDFEIIFILGYIE